MPAEPPTGKGLGAWRNAKQQAVEALSPLIASFRSL